MRLGMVLLCGCLVCLLIAGTSPGQPRTGSESSSACTIVRKALDDSQRIKPGMKRRQIEEYFKPDGGLQFPDNTRYVYRACGYIKLEVQFDASPLRGGNLISPDDTVRTASKLYIEYPTMD